MLCLLSLELMACEALLIDTCIDNPQAMMVVESPY